MRRGTVVAARAPAPAGEVEASGTGAEVASRRGTDPDSDPFGWIAGLLAVGALVWLGGRRELGARPEPTG